MGLMLYRGVSGTAACALRRHDPIGGLLARMFAVLLVLVAALALGCGSAQAKLVRPFVSSFGSFSNVQGVAVDSSSGAVYVYDAGAQAILKFDASGKPVNFSGTASNAISGVGGSAYGGPAESEIAVDNSSGPAKGDIYLARGASNVAVYSPEGLMVGELTEEPGVPWGAEVCGVSVDSSGVVYVGIYSGYVNKYLPSGNPLKPYEYQSSLQGVPSPCEVAVDSAGNVFANKYPGGPLTRFEPGQFGSPSATGAIVSEKGATLAVDPANAEVYVDEGQQVSQFGPHGEPFKTPVWTFADSGPGTISGSYGIAVSGFNRDVYVSDGKGGVSTFGQLTLETVPPVVEEEYVSDVAATSATFGAHLNAEGRDTTYRFEYGPSASYGSSTPGLDAGSSLNGEAVHAHIQGLALDTTYHYRIVATNSVGTTDGPDRTFATQAAGSPITLLDGRQWELVSPPNKHGATILPIATQGVIQAAADGHAISYYVNAPIAEEPQGYSSDLQAFSLRNGPQTWSTQDVATPHDAATSLSIGEGYEYRFFSRDLSLALVEPQGPFTPLSDEATERTPYIRDDTSCAPPPSVCYTPLVTAGNVPPGTKFGGDPSRLRGDVRFVGATPDLHDVVLSSPVGLTATSGDEGGLYEWSDGKLQLVSVLPASEGAGPEKKVRLGDEFVGTDARNAIARNGARVFWSVFPSGGLYMRDTVTRETIRIGSGHARFQAADVKGSHVFFISQTDALEECHIVEVARSLACDITQLAPSIDGGVLGASEDGSYVYFVSNAALTPQAVSGTCGPFASSAADTCNLYVAHDSDTGWESPKLIGVLSNSDGPDWAAGSDGGSLVGMTARVSPNGRWLAFMSQRGLTGYDTHDAESGQPAEEVYLYDDAAERLVCASCNPSGGRPKGSMYGNGIYGYGHPGLLGGGDSVWSPEAWLAANIPGWTPYQLDDVLYQSRYLSDRGRLFFNAGDALVPQDVNGTWDVYEYEPPGVGGCALADASFASSAAGCVGLISSGRSAEQSAFMDASESGDDVFFLTASHLSGQDVDTSDDLYDAHVCSTGAPCASLPVSPPPCTTGDSCKAPPSPQPTVFGAPPSATFAGIGNVVSAKSVVHKSLTRAQKRRRALAVCRRKSSRRKRRACERKARLRYGATRSAKVKATKRGDR